MGKRISEEVKNLSGYEGVSRLLPYPYETKSEFKGVSRKSKSDYKQSGKGKLR
jgi:hypothetical protein